jgi:hypothetical protein
MTKPLRLKISQFVNFLNYLKLQAMVTSKVLAYLHPLHAMFLWYRSVKLLYCNMSDLLISEYASHSCFCYGFHDTKLRLTLLTYVIHVLYVAYECSSSLMMMIHNGLKYSGGKIVNISLHIQVSAPSVGYCFAAMSINPLNTKRRLLYLKTQFVPRCKHFSSRL